MEESENMAVYDEATQETEELVFAQLASMVTGVLAYDEERHLHGNRPFPFLELPAELRNRVYAYLLTNTRAPQSFQTHRRDGSIIRVPKLVGNEIHVNDLARRNACRRYSKFTGLSKASKQFAMAYHFLNDGDATAARLVQRVSKLPPLLETAILRACHQTFEEGIHVLYTLNTFSVILCLNIHVNPFDTRLPHGVDVSRVQRLRVEIQLFSNPQDGGPRSRIGLFRDKTWSAFRRMVGLKYLQIIVTFGDEKAAVGLVYLFNRAWHQMPYFTNIMRDLVSAIPKGIEVQCGLTKEQKDMCNFGGFEPVKGCVLRKIFDTYERFKGVDVGIPDINMDDLLDRDAIHHLAIDGDAVDSDEENAASA